MDEKALSTQETTQLSTMEKNIKDLFKKKTDKKVILQRQGAGGRMFPYVPIDYVLSELDRVFGIYWEFIIDDVTKTEKQIIVRGKLVIKSPNGFSISRPGIGRKTLTFYKDSTTKLVDEGNDEKGAVADAIKKAASLFGVAADVYYQELEKYEQIQNQQTEDEAQKQSLMSRYFAMASERGMTGEVAKEKVKIAFKVAHMADLSIDQFIHAISLLEKNYEVVEPGEDLRKKGVNPASSSTSSHADLPDHHTASGDESGGEEVDLAKVIVCKDPTCDIKEEHAHCYSDKKQIPPGEYYCNEACQEVYWDSPKGKEDRFEAFLKRKKKQE
jgi:hypothetical protein